MAEETKHDLFLKRIQITIAILAGVTTLILGVYNVKRNVFSKVGAGEISLKVRSESGQGINEAEAELYNGQNAIVAASDTDSKGLFEKKGLEAGSYILKIKAKGYEPEAVTVQVDSGKVTDLAIALRAIPTPSTSLSSPQPAAGTTAQPSNKIKSTLEDVGASWLKKLAASDTKTPSSETSTQ